MPEGPRVWTTDSLSILLNIGKMQDFRMTIQQVLAEDMGFELAEPTSELDELLDSQILVPDSYDRMFYRWREDRFLELGITKRLRKVYVPDFMTDVDCSKSCCDRRTPTLYFTIVMFTHHLASHGNAIFYSGWMQSVYKWYSTRQAPRFGDKRPRKSR